MPSIRRSSSSTEAGALPPPDAAVWRRRAAWFAAAHDAQLAPTPLELDARAGALLAELEVAFCAGAWAAVVTLAYAMVERTDEGRDAPDLDWLREQRNRLVHGDAAGAWPEEAALEVTAQGAVRVAFRALFAAAWR